MDNIYYEKILYRIIQGRLRLPFGDPVLYLYEPDKDIIEESYEIYDETYEESYFSGVPIKSELKEILFNNSMWSPDDDKMADDIESQIEEAKVYAYENYYNTPKLNGIKLSLRNLESQYNKYKSRFLSLDHISCEGAANFARSVWIISKTIKDKEQNIVKSKELPLTKVLEYYKSKTITASDFRYIARNEPFRSMWSAGKKTSNVFGKPTCDLTKDQLSLVQFSSMYDNVYESHESPHEDVVKDDDCLDGWFIVQKREYEKGKNQKEVDKMLGNSKIANSQEVFVMAKDTHTAKKINSMNSPVANMIKANRDQQIKEKGSLNFTEFADVQQDIITQSSQQAIKTIRGK